MHELIANFCIRKLLIYAHASMHINGQHTGKRWQCAALARTVRTNMKKHSSLDLSLHECPIKNDTCDLMLFIFHLFHMQLWKGKENPSRQITWCPISSKSPNPSYYDLLNHKRILNLMVQVLILLHAFMLQWDPESLPMSFLLNSSQ